MLPAGVCGFILACGLGAGVALAFQHGSTQPAAAPAASTPAASATAGDASAAKTAAAATATAEPTVDGATLDDRFLTVLRMQGITPSADGGSTTITDAHGVCILFDRGQEPEQVGTLMTAGGMTDRQARLFVGASVAAYCPRYVDAVRPYADGH
ncbi:DUF732 domain-containing protein [Modestobacter excelsi]|uniref:DUF732 domain-containing protein n=1 Tax=Modestobacter excelsi TaxID=2213161 RepID=UPI001C20E7DD|nr:DUF732 domain-containing protein [Modestobacter excelsi]